MSKIKLEKYTDSYFEKWNSFVQDSINGTIFHRLDFLKYHGSKFDHNQHHLMWLKGEEIYAVMPLGVFRENENLATAKSPFGASWGGLVYQEHIPLRKMIYIIQSFIKYMKSIKVNYIDITPTPYPYHKNYNSIFEFCLLNAGFKFYNQDIMHVTILPENEKEVMPLLNSKARNKVKNANENFNFYENVNPESFYDILLQDKKRHKSTPTHSKEELKVLQETLPNDIFFDIAVNKQNEAGAGICYFTGNSNCISTFYMSQEDKALGFNGVNALILKGMEKAIKNKFTFFDFGCSSVNMKIENIGVANFKENFGAICYPRNSYRYEFSR